MRNLTRKGANRCEGAFSSDCTTHKQVLKAAMSAASTRHGVAPALANMQMELAKAALAKRRGSDCSSPGSKTIGSVPRAAVNTPTSQQQQQQHRVTSSSSPTSPELETLFRPEEASAGPSLVVDCDLPSLELLSNAPMPHQTPEKVVMTRLEVRDNRKPL